MLDIRYTLAMPEPQTHLYHVAIDVSGVQNGQVDFVMPVWTPGAYSVVDFARHVQDFSAGRLAWRKVDKSRWRVVTGGASAVRVAYKVWAFELEVDRSHLDAEHGYFNGAGVFMYVDRAKERPVTLDVRAPRGWRVVTGLDGGPTRFTAPSYDVLIDCPTEVGTAPVKTFRVAGKEHRVLVHGVCNWDHERLTRECERLVKTQLKLFGVLPYRHYTFLFHPVTTRALGGLEHLNSTSITMEPWIGRPKKSREALVEVTSHEFFHLWNVKRIHPKVLGPFDYEREVYTKLLWVMEGITSYYDDLMCCRAHLYDSKRYLKKVAEAVQRYREKPSRLRQSLTQSSFDTWLWKYKTDGNILNRMMSYYEKGSLVGMCLDLEIRRRTRNAVSLDDVMRRLWREYASKSRFLEEDEIQPVVERVAGGRYGDFFSKYVDGTAEVPFESFLRAAGLEYRKEPVKQEGEAEPKETPWLGVTTKNGPERPVVTLVTEGSPAFQVGINPDDELVALDGIKLDNANFATLLKERKPGRKASLALFRGARLIDLELVLGRRENVSVEIVPRKDATSAQKAVFADWLKHPWRPPKPPKKED